MLFSYGDVKTFNSSPFATVQANHRGCQLKVMISVVIFSVIQKPIVILEKMVSYNSQLVAGEDSNIQVDDPHAFGLNNRDNPTQASV